MDFPLKIWISRILPILATLLLFNFLGQEIYTTMKINPRLNFMALVTTSLAQHGNTQNSNSSTSSTQNKDIDINWYPPISSPINNSTGIISRGEGEDDSWDFIYNSSITPDEKYGSYNWCNMPHVRVKEYIIPPKEYKLRYVEIIHRHHKRTVYASNAFPVESYPWNCDDTSLFYYGQPLPPIRLSTQTYWKITSSPINPFTPPGFQGTCQFPQITSGGLQDSYQHGLDLHAVYHTLLNFLPSNALEKGAAEIRVTTNQITSQVASSLLPGLFPSNTKPYALIVQQSTIDSLEPTYPCPLSTTLFTTIKSSPTWLQHLQLSQPLFQQLDLISGVPSSDEGFHVSFDHYYDNLSARQCHSLPLPCSIPPSSSSSPQTCIPQFQANTVYKLGNWEYDFIYRSHPLSLSASSTSFGIWILELIAHFKDVMNGINKDVGYRHNVAHDGSLARLLSVLQVERMVWPGMGAEVVFEVYEWSGLGGGEGEGDVGGEGGGNGKWFIRILWGGSVLRSSNPSLGVVDMVALERVVGYLEGVVGVDGAVVKERCGGSA